jgi:hypothetical protein
LQQSAKHMVVFRCPGHGLPLFVSCKNRIRNCGQGKA